MSSRRRLVLTGGVMRTLRADIGHAHHAEGPTPPSSPRRRVRERFGLGVRFIALVALFVVCAGGESRLPDLATQPTRIARAGEPRQTQPSTPALTQAEAQRLNDEIAAEFRSLGTDAVGSVWVGGAEGTPWYSWQAGTPRPSASAIKTAFLVELLDRHAATLDGTLAGLEDVLRDGHPALAPFEVAQRQEIRKALAGSSARKLGRIMMGSEPAPNFVYNAAASAVIGLFGGPEALTRAIRERDPAFASFAVRRYMLAPRDITGDNEATAAGLAAVLQRLASGRLSGVDAETLEAIRASVLVAPDHLGLPGRHFVKSGALDSDPITRVESGWWESPQGRPLVYVVMAAQPAPPGMPRAEAARKVSALTQKLTRRLLEQAVPSP